MRRFAVALLTLAALTVAAAPGAQATDARMQGLLYNLAFEDDTDVFLFPNQLPDYRGVYFHLPPAIEDVFGGVVLGSRESAFAAFIHRPWLSPFDQYRILVTDTLNNTGVGLLQGNPGNATERHEPGQIFDLMYGAKTWGLGLRFHGWSEVSVREGQLEQAAGVNNDLMAIDLNGGFRLMDGLHLRTNLGVGWVKDTGLLFRAFVGTRYIQPDVAKTMRYVLAGELQIGVYAPEDGDTSFGLTLPLKGGYRLTLLPDTLFLGLLAGIDLQVVKRGVDGDEGDANVGLAVPTLEFAVEWLALEWLHLRSSIKGGYGIQFAGGPNDNTPKYEQMVFATGIGFLLGPFTADATIQYALWRNGPDFISGAAPGLFGSVSLAYQY